MSSEMLVSEPGQFLGDIPVVQRLETPRLEQIPRSVERAGDLVVQSSGDPHLALLLAFTEYADLDTLALHHAVAGLDTETFGDSESGHLEKPDDHGGSFRRPEVARNFQKVSGGTYERRAR